MTEAHAVELMLEQFVNNWPTLSAAITFPDGTTYAGGIPYALENEALPAADAFAQVTIRHSVTELITAGNSGNRRWRRRGQIYVKLWVPADGGRAAMSSLCDIVRTIYEGVPLSVPPEEPVTLPTATTREIGVDGRWYMAAVQVDFRYYQQH